MGIDHDKIIEYILSKIGDVSIEAFLQFLKNETQMSRLKIEIEKQLDDERQRYNVASVDSCFMFDKLTESIVIYLVNQKAIVNLLSVDKACREEEIITITNLCVQEATPENRDALSNVNRIVNACINCAYSFFERQVSFQTKYEEKEIVEAIDKSLDNGISQLEQKVSQEFRGSEQMLQRLEQKIDRLSKTNLTSDNCVYLDLFSKKLFLDEEFEGITLQTMYTEPLLVGETVNAHSFVEEWRKQKDSCLLLYGDAGIGKSSFIAKLVDEACSKEECIDNPNDASVLAITLRNHCDEIIERMNKVDPVKEIFKIMFGVNDLNALQGKLLILDGYDELTVLIDGFKEKAAAFVTLICSKCKDYHLNVLITSREGYFDEVLDVNLTDRRLCWNEEKVKEWCDKYKACKPILKERIDLFLRQYGNLPRLDPTDKRFEALSVPFILYLCCNGEVDLIKDNSIVKIYNKAFRKLLLREHNQVTKSNPFNNALGNKQLRLSDEQLRLVFWQYTKEIAYQMFLLGTLNLADSNGSDCKENKGLENAKRRTVAILRDRGLIISEADLRTTQYLSVFTFSKPDNTGGIAFVHKTVYDFFTAIKLYEDYFSEINEMNLKDMSEKEMITKMLENTVEAFRYHSIPQDIFSYMCEMNEMRFQDDNLFDSDLYINLLMKAIDEAYFAKIELAPAIQEYLYPSNTGFTYPICEQIVQVICCAICFISGHGYRNIECNEELVRFLKLSLFESLQDVEMRRWNLRGADLSGIHLECSLMAEAILDEANLSGSCFRSASLANASLNDAHLERANLEYTNLTGADLQSAHLERAFMRYTDLDYSDLKHARLERAILEETNLKSADLSHANMVYANMERVDFNEAYAISAVLNHAYIVDCDFRRAFFNCANFGEAYLNNNELKGAYFEGAHFENAYLIDNDFQDAHFEHAHFEDAIIIGSYLFDAHFEGAWYNGKTVFPRGFDPDKHGMKMIEY